MTVCVIIIAACSVVYVDCSVLGTECLLYCLVELVLHWHYVYYNMTPVSTCVLDVVMNSVQRQHEARCSLNVLMQAFQFCSLMWLNRRQFIKLQLTSDRGYFITLNNEFNVNLCIFNKLQFLPKCDYLMYRSLLTQIRLSSVMFVRPTHGVETFCNISLPFCTLAILRPLWRIHGHRPGKPLRCKRGIATCVTFGYLISW